MEDSVEFLYNLTNNATGLDVQITANARFSTERGGIRSGNAGIDGEIWTLRDDSKAFVGHEFSRLYNSDKYYCTFSWGGIVYNMSVVGADDASIKQILSDFNVL